jgi:phosphohistidine phosphatase
MPVLYLVRHAEAELQGKGGDEARRLTAGGRRRFAELVRALAPQLRVTRVVSSPALRALETAGILAAASARAVEEEGALGSGRSSDRDLLDLGRAMGDGTALVGHNPELAAAVALAAGREERVAPGTIAAVEAAPGGWRLLWIRSP